MEYLLNFLGAAERVAVGEDAGEDVDGHESRYADPAGEGRGEEHHPGGAHEAGSKAATALLEVCLIHSIETFNFVAQLSHFSGKHGIPRQITHSYTLREEKNIIWIIMTAQEAKIDFDGYFCYLSCEMGYTFLLSQQLSFGLQNEFTFIFVFHFVWNWLPTTITLTLRDATAFRAFPCDIAENFSMASTGRRPDIEAPLMRNPGRDIRKLGRVKGAGFDGVR
nr:hypothetical protein Iba_chr01dCG11670 [Ipomoea batatas]